MKLVVPAFLENPAGSMLWLAPPIASVCVADAKCTHRNSITDFCQHGARWRKRTRIASWNAVDCPGLNVTCCGHGGICSLSGKFHVVLKGADPISKQLWTHIAQPYPMRFAACAAKLMIDSADNIKNNRLHMLCKTGFLN